MKYLTWIAVVVLLPACGEPTAPIFGTTTQARVRFVNATTDVNALNFNVNGQAAVQSVPFGTPTGCQSFNAGPLAVTATQAGASFGGTFNQTLAPNGRFTVVATGSAADPQFLLLNDVTAAPPAGTARVRVINAVPGTTASDVFVTAPDVSLGLPTATNVRFNSATGFVDVPAGQTQIRFTNAGTQTVSFTGTPFNLNAGQTTTVIVAPGTTFGTFRTFNVLPC